MLPQFQESRRGKGGRKLNGMTLTSLNVLFIEHRIAFGIQCETFCIHVLGLPKRL